LHYTPPFYLRTQTAVVMSGTPAQQVSLHVSPAWVRSPDALAYSLHFAVSTTNGTAPAPRGYIIPNILYIRYKHITSIYAYTGYIYPMLSLLPYALLL